MSKSKRGPRPVTYIEATRGCPRCGAAKGERCTNYSGRPKATCEERKNERWEPDKGDAPGQMSLFG